MIAYLHRLIIGKTDPQNKIFKATLGYKVAFYYKNKKQIPGGQAVF